MRGRASNEVEEVKGNKQNETSVTKTDEKPEVKQEQKVKEVEKEVHRCDQCKWYDVSTQRDFHRDGIRKGLVEVRAVCRSPTARAKGHLVKNDSDRPCFEEGVYVKPQKPKKKTKKSMTKEEIKEKNPELSNVVEVLDASLVDRQKRATKTAKRIMSFVKQGFDVNLRQSEIHKVIADQLEVSKPNINNRSAIAIRDYLKDKHSVVAQLSDIQKIVKKGLKVSKKTLSKRANGDIVVLEKRNGKTFVVNK